MEQVSQGKKLEFKQKLKKRREEKKIQMSVRKEMDMKHVLQILKVKMEESKREVR